MSIGIYYWRPVSHVLSLLQIVFWVYGADPITTPGRVNLK
jgi:hypothetical protein